MHGVRALRAGATATPARTTSAEVRVVGDLPLRPAGGVDGMPPRPSSASGSSGEPGPDHEAVGPRVTAGDAERERVRPGQNRRGGRAGVERGSRHGCGASGDQAGFHQGPASELIATEPCLVQGRARMNIRWWKVPPHAFPRQNINIRAFRLMNGKRRQQGNGFATRPLCGWSVPMSSDVGIESVGGGAGRRYRRARPPRPGCPAESRPAHPPADQLAVGLVLYGVTLAMLIRATLGNAPWDVLHQGMAIRCRSRSGRP